MSPWVVRAGTGPEFATCSFLWISNHRETPLLMGSVLVRVHPTRTLYCNRLIPPQPLPGHRHRLMPNLTFFIQIPRHCRRSSWPYSSHTTSYVMHTPSSLQVTADSPGPFLMSSYRRANGAVPTISRIYTSGSRRKTVRYSSPHSR